MTLFVLGLISSELERTKGSVTLIAMVEPFWLLEACTSHDLFNTANQNLNLPTCVMLVVCFAQR